MKKGRLLAAVLCSLCMLAGSVIPAHADGMKVVALGADLSDAQKQTMLNYFKVNPSQVQIIYVTNQDERAHLAGYVPLEQIGTRTVSCAYVKPTNSGGIKVRTANLNWVTGNMIASTLSTSGVKNCEVIAACPFEVSGTGALTGIQMAYETASGTQLDSTKKQIATEEIVVTGNLADSVGRNAATSVINGSKIEIVENHVHNETEIYNIVNSVAVENNVTLDPATMQEIVNLLLQYAEQEYAPEDVMETLDRVEENVSGNAGSEMEDPAEADSPETGENAEEAGQSEAGQAEEDEDSIFTDVDESVLGEGVISSSTEDTSLEEETYPVEEGTGQEEETFSDGWETFPSVDESEELIPVDETEGETPSEPEEGFESFDGTEDFGSFEDPGTWTEEPSQSVDETEFGTENESGESGAEDESWTGEESGDYSFEDTYQEPEQPAESTADGLSEQAKYQYEQAQAFCKGEYEGEAGSLIQAMGPDFYPSTYISDMEVARTLTDKVTSMYLDILKNGSIGYTPDGNDTYISDELNLIRQKLEKLFQVGSSSDGADSEIAQKLNYEDRQDLYNDTMTFFEKVYGEYTDYDGEASYEDTWEEDAGNYEEEGFEEYSEEEYNG